MSHRIVLTGAPASGKSDFLHRLQKEAGFESFAFFEEMARTLLEENPGFRQNWNDFHRQILKRQKAREDALGGGSFVSDRGTVDAFAFHPEMLAELGTSLGSEYNRYTAVIHLGSTANLGEKFYTTDHVRNESLDEALAIEAAIKKAWQPHPGYRFIMAVPDLAGKYELFLATVEGLIRKN